MTTALDDVLSRFAPLAGLPGELGPARTVRGTALAVALEWLVRLPDGDHKERALWYLQRAGEEACEAYESVSDRPRTGSTPSRI